VSRLKEIQKRELADLFNDSTFSISNPSFQILRDSFFEFDTSRSLYAMVWPKILSSFFLRDRMDELDRFERISIRVRTRERNVISRMMILFFIDLTVSQSSEI
jgi:hypothetical protein